MGFLPRLDAIYALVNICHGDLFPFIFHDTHFPLFLEKIIVLSLYPLLLFPFRHFSPLIAFHLPSFSTDTEVFFLDFASKTSHGSELSICLTSDAMNGEVISVPGVQAEESALQPCAASWSNKE